MKSIRVLIFTYGLIVIGCSNPNYITDLNKNELKGSVKSIKYTVYEADEKFGELKKGKVNSLFKNDMIFYNKEGYITEKVFYHDDLSIMKTKRILFNENYHPIEENYFDANNILLGKVKYEYSDTILNKKIFYNSNGALIKKVDYQYDSHYNKIFKETVDSVGVKTKLYLLKYDTQNNLIETQSYSKGQLLSIVKFLYNSKGKKVEFYRKNLIYNNDETKETYKYNEEGNIVQQDNYNNNILLSSIIYSYNENNNLVKKKRTCFSTSLSWCPSYEIDYHYDTNNNLIEEKSESSKEQYVYDDNGNWIRKIYLRNNNSTITERIILYY